LYYTAELDIIKSSYEEIAKIIETLRNNKSLNENKVPAKLLKKVEMIY